MGKIVVHQIIDMDRDCDKSFDGQWYCVEFHTKRGSIRVSLMDSGDRIDVAGTGRILVQPDVANRVQIMIADLDDVKKEKENGKDRNTQPT